MHREEMVIFFNFHVRKLVLFWNDNEPTGQLGALSKRDVSKYLPTFISLIVGQFHLFKTNR